MTGSMGEKRDWHAWYEQYDDPDSSLSRRLAEVRTQLGRLLERYVGPVRLLSLCAGDGRDTIPVLAASDREVEACLVELDPGLAQGARDAATAAGLEVDVRTADAGDPRLFADRLPVDVLMLCGIFGNVSDASIEQTVDAARSMLTPGAAVIWTRGSRVPGDPTDQQGDAAQWVRGRFGDAGFEEVAFVAPEDASYRVGVARLAEPSTAPLPERLFSFER